MALRSLVTHGLLGSRACLVTHGLESSLVVDYPVWIDIVNQVKSIIGAMTTGAGYSLTYGSIDEIVPSLRTYPCVFLDYKEETGLDEAGRVAGRITARTRLDIRVLLATSSDLAATTQKAVADFTSALSNGMDGLREVGLLMLDYVGAAMTFRETKAYPCELTVSFNCTHRRQKLSPYLT